LPPTPLDGLQCNCPDSAVRRISHTAQNPERPFWCCRMGRDDPNRCKFFKWEDEISATPTTSRGPGSNNHPRSPSSAAQESPRKRAILETLRSEEPVTPLKPQASPRASQASTAALLEQLGDTHDDDDDELFHTSQVFKFDPYGGKERSQASPFSTPTFSVPRATNGATLNTPLDSALKKGKTKDKSLFDPPESPLHKARDTSVPSRSPFSPLDHQSSGGRGQESDTDDPSIYIDAVKKLDALPAYLNKLQDAKKTAEAELREYKEGMRALQMENERLKARQPF